MPAHGSLWFGPRLGPDEWEDIKQQLWSSIDFDPYEPKV